MAGMYKQGNKKILSGVYSNITVQPSDTRRCTQTKVIPLMSNSTPHGAICAIAVVGKTIAGFYVIL